MQSKKKNTKLYQKSKLFLRNVFLALHSIVIYIFPLLYHLTFFLLYFNLFSRSHTSKKTSAKPLLLNTCFPGVPVTHTQHHTHLFMGDIFPQRSRRINQDSLMGLMFQGFCAS